MNIYPLRITPSPQVRVWGGIQLATRLGKVLPSTEPYGESWEIYHTNAVENGAYQGITLAELIAKFPEPMTGNADASSDFPLLVKFLDAQDWLSVQVHPNDLWAARLEGELRGKTECWYVVAADPDAQLIFGFGREVTAEAFRTAIQEGKVRDLLQFVPVKQGDFVYVPAGTIHAIGKGLLMYELQQTSDTTYRIYDWDRMGLDGRPRQLHLEKALACANYTINPAAKVEYTMEHHDGYDRGVLVHGQYFSLERIVIGSAFASSTDNNARLITVINGSGRILSNDGVTEAPLGCSLFLPAALGDYKVEGDCEVLIAW